MTEDRSQSSSDLNSPQEIARDSKDMSTTSTDVTQPVRIKTDQKEDQGQTNDERTTPTFVAKQDYQESVRANPNIDYPKEKTQKIVVKIVSELTASNSYSRESAKIESLDNLPDWLVKFAAQDLSSTADKSLSEITQKVIVPMTDEEHPDSEQPTAGLGVSNPDISEWTSESELLTQVPTIEAYLTIDSPSFENYQAEKVKIQAGKQVNKENEISSGEEEQQLGSPDSKPADNPPRFPENFILSQFSQDLNSGNYQSAVQLIRKNIEDTEITSYATVILRKYLSLNSKAGLLWELYADLNKQSDNLFVAQQARDVSELLKPDNGVVDGTITCID